MGHISRTIHVEATPEQVFDLWAQPERFREWQVPATEVKDITGTPGTVGYGWTSVTTFVGRKMEAAMRVTAVERPRFVEAKSTGIGNVRMHFEPATGGTDITGRERVRDAARLHRRRREQALLREVVRGVLGQVAGELQGARGGRSGGPRSREQGLARSWPFPPIPEGRGGQFDAGRPAATTSGSGASPRAAVTVRPSSTRRPQDFGRR